MRFRNSLKICLLVLCLSWSPSTTGTPQNRGANFFMKSIKLDKGLSAMVDDADFEELNKFKWYADKIGNTFYAKRRAFVGDKYTAVYMHRHILMPPKNIVVDHKNHNGLDNQRSNLRECTRGQNQINQRSQKNSSSKYLGVSWSKERKKWQAHCCKNYKVYSCGRFDNEADAALAYNELAKRLHGEFANLNILK